MPAHPLVSIVVPCHRAQTTIAEMAASVLAQSLSDWEMILVSDDGHDYRAQLRSLGLDDRRIRQHPLRTRQYGHVAARSRGLAMVRGRLVADLDSDDIWRPDRLARLAPLALRHGAAQDGLECFDQSGNLGRYGPGDGRVEILPPAGVTRFDLPFHMVARRELVGPPWFAYESAAPDPVRAAVLAAKGQLVWLGAHLLRYRVHDQSMSQSVSGGWRVDRAYGEILETLSLGDGFGLAPPHRHQVRQGFCRKRRLNRRHMALRRADPSTPPFIAWVLAGAGGTPLGEPFG